jgi:hypothetical protein
MALYTFRCPQHGDFQVEQTMRETTRNAVCPHMHSVGIPATRCPKVVGSNLQFTYGRENFHDGPEGDGATVRETGDRWRKEFTERTGREAVGSARWV